MEVCLLHTHPSLPFPLVFRPNYSYLSSSVWTTVWKLPVDRCVLLAASHQCVSHFLYGWLTDKIRTSWRDYQPNERIAKPLIGPRTRRIPNTDEFNDEPEQLYLKLREWNDPCWGVIFACCARAFFFSILLLGDCATLGHIWSAVSANCLQEPGHRRHCDIVY